MFLLKKAACLAPKGPTVGLAPDIASPVLQDHGLTRSSQPPAPYVLQVLHLPLLVRSPTKLVRIARKVITTVFQAARCADLALLAIIAPKLVRRPSETRVLLEHTLIK